MRTRERRRSLVVLLVVAVLVGTVAGTAAAASEPRSEPRSSPPATVYVSETLDISDVELTGSSNDIDDEPVTLRRVDGNVSVDIEDPTQANFSGVEPGSYYVVEGDDERPEIEVVEPNVTSLVLTSNDGRNVTNRSVRSLSVLIINAEYNFDNADRLDVRIHGPDGERLGLNPKSARITESGGRLSVYMADRPSGTYTVTVQGSGIPAGVQSETVTVRGERTPTATATATPTATATATPTPTATATPTPTATPAPTSTATPTATPSPTPTDGAGDGFGIGLTVLALLGSMIVVLRRR